MIAAAAYCVFLWILRNSPYQADPLLDTYLEMAGSLIAFTFAANAMVRFRGTHDRISLILAFGFVLAGLIEAGTSMTFYRGMLVAASTGGAQISFGWLAGRTLLGVLLLAAWWSKTESRSRANRARKSPAPRSSSEWSPISPAFFISCFRMRRRFIPAQSSLDPGTCSRRRSIGVATIGYGLRLRRANAALDRALFFAAALNVICHMTMSQSERPLDAALHAGAYLCDCKLRGCAGRNSAR